ncbi:MAG: division/cell wall cluster transcriptional repressor MraZ [Actinomycetota bacterium]
MFLGTHSPRLDEKGRLFLPAKFRAELAAGLVITRGQDRCLFVYPMAEFARLAEAARAAPTTMGEARKHVRMLSSSASDEVPDRQGRITVPQQLREYAGLHRDCAVIGALSRVEIWDAARWAQYVEANEQDYSDQDEEVVPGLI